MKRSRKTQSGSQAEAPLRANTLGLVETPGELIYGTWNRAQCEKEAKERSLSPGGERDPRAGSVLAS